MSLSPLAANVALRVQELIRDGAVPVGSKISERTLSAQLRVSRTPVSAALKELVRQGSMARLQSGEYVIPSAAMPVQSSSTQFDPLDEVYLKVASDRLSGAIPLRVTESEMQRRYDLSRSSVRRLLHRIASEAWIERLPGHGWEFLPMLTSIEAYEQSFSFRQVIEPAALLEKTFSADRALLEARLREQHALAGGGVGDVSRIRLFEMNSAVHQTIMDCSGNLFFSDALKRVDRLRRIFEYNRPVDLVAAQRRCHEHVVLLELVLSGKNAQASELMRRHLSSVKVEKARR